MSRKFRSTNNMETDNVIIYFISEHPECTVFDIAAETEMSLTNIRRILHGRTDRSEPIGLVNSGAVLAVADINAKGRLVWRYKARITDDDLIKYSDSTANMKWSNDASMTFNAPLTKNRS